MGLLTWSWAVVWGVVLHSAVALGAPLVNFLPLLDAGIIRDDVWEDGNRCGAAE
jgi:hypothetical protein